MMADKYIKELKKTFSNLEETKANVKINMNAFAFYQSFQ
jgi:hypothetical protein